MADRSRNKDGQKGSRLTAGIPDHILNPTPPQRQGQGYDPEFDSPCRRPDTNCPPPTPGDERCPEHDHHAPAAPTVTPSSATTPSAVDATPIGPVSSTVGMLKQAIESLKGEIGGIDDQVERLKTQHRQQIGELAGRKEALINELNALGVNVEVFINPVRQPPTPAATPKRRGRPPGSTNKNTTKRVNATETTIPKRRGRPAKATTTPGRRGRPARATTTAPKRGRPAKAPAPAPKRGHKRGEGPSAREIILLQIGEADAPVQMVDIRNNLRDRGKQSNPSMEMKRLVRDGLVRKDPQTQGYEMVPKSARKNY
jgi:hypothetical protein